MTKNELEPKAVAYTKSLSDGKRGNAGIAFFGAKPYSGG